MKTSRVIYGQWIHSQSTFRFPEWLTCLLTSVQKTWERAQHRRELDHLSDHLRRDLGLAERHGSTQTVSAARIMDLRWLRYIPAERR